MKSAKLSNDPSSLDNSSSSNATRRFALSTKIWSIFRSKCRQILTTKSLRSSVKIVWKTSVRSVGGSWIEIEDIFDFFEFVDQRVKICFFDLEKSKWQLFMLRRKQVWSVFRTIKTIISKSCKCFQLFVNISYNFRFSRCLCYYIILYHRLKGLLWGRKKLITVTKWK